MAIASERQLKISEQMATGKKVNLPSDDPLAAQAITSLREMRSRSELYMRNVNSADQRWRLIESEIGSVNELLIRGKELAIQANNGTLGAEQRRVIAAEVSQLSQQLLAAGNKQVNGEYIFAGYRSDARPFERAAGYPNANPAVTYAGDGNIKQIQIGEDEWFDIQVRGDHLFQGDGTADAENLFQTFANLEQALLTNNIDDTDAGSVGQAIEDLDGALRQVQGQLASVGSKTNRLEMLKGQLQEQDDLNKEFLSQYEDIDLAEAAYEFQRAQIVLQATVNSAGAILNRPSLLDFLGR
jgi:flagellar hook-associated protein 3 FlgL